MPSFSSIAIRSSTFAGDSTSELLLVLGVGEAAPGAIEDIDRRLGRDVVLCKSSAVIPSISHSSLCASRRARLSDKGVISDAIPADPEGKSVTIPKGMRVGIGGTGGISPPDLRPGEADAILFL